MTIQNDFFIKDELWYKIGGVVKFFLSCNSREDVLEAINFIREKKIDKVFVAGLGSNLIFTDEYYDGAVIQIYANGNSANGMRINDDGLVEVFAGVEFDDLIKFAFEYNLVGLEWAGGLPGTVGGAVRGNAGAYGGEIKDNLISAEVLDYSVGVPIIKTFTNEELQFSYRSSLIKQSKKFIVLSAKFKLASADGSDLEKARNVYQEKIQDRKNKHPLEYPNTGSVFINPREKHEIEKILSIYPDLRESVEKKWYGKLAVAALIDLWGLKGFRVGDAQISEKHALFIVNLGDAKFSDVLEIIKKVRDKFFETFGFELKIEAEIIK